jgi:Flp pilus assembly protein TadD
MMKINVGMKFAVSALAVTTTMVACKPAAQAYRIGSASSVAPKSEKQANALSEKAQASAQKGDYAGALADAEKAVELSPRDAGYRMLLADLYLKNGRFQSAETSFKDVLALDPDNSRAALSSVLAQIALGRQGAAVAQLDRLAQTAPAGDVGLAYALAGQPERALQLLEAAARAPGATGRVRQNLALAYALAGNWQKARTVAAQDVSPAELGARLEQWAALARPGSSSGQVAALLGVHAAADPGQPTRLALAAPAPAPTAYAAAEPVAAPEPAPEPVVVAQAAPAPEPVAEAAPVQTAQAELPAWLSERPSAPEQAAEETKPVYAEAVQSLIAPRPGLIRASAPLPAPIRRFEAPRRAATALRASPAGGGRFAVQLGAFATANAVERAWASAYRRYGFASHIPLSTTVKVAGRGTFHRLSVAGFQNRAEADGICRSVRSKGGACFVRATAGDAPVQWASRYAPSRRG